MPQRKVILYIAMSLDGFIAREDGDLSWLSMVEMPGEDYGYHQFINTIDTVIMGRKTYEKVLSFGTEFPHRNKKCYVLSTRLKGKNEQVEFYQGDVRKLIQIIRQQKGLDIFCDGGAQTVFELMKYQLIDQYVISIIPVILGSGIPLFPSGRPEQTLAFIRCKTFPSGLVQLWYKRK